MKKLILSIFLFTILNAVILPMEIKDESLITILEKVAEKYEISVTTELAHSSKNSKNITDQMFSIDLGGEPKLTEVFRCLEKQAITPIKILQNNFNPNIFAPVNPLNLIYFDSIFDLNICLSDIKS